MINLMFHVVAGRGGSRFVVSPAVFKKAARSFPPKVITVDDAYEDCVEPLLALPDECRLRAILFPVADFVGCTNTWDGSGELAGRKLMTWNHLAQLAKAGLTIGSHGAAHLDLRSLSNEELKKEIDGSKQVLEDRLGVQVSDFCYPYGLFNNRVIAAVDSAGFQRAFTTSSSVLQGRGNCFRIPRVEITGTDTGISLFMKLSGAYRVEAISELPKLMLEKLMQAKNTHL